MDLLTLAQAARTLGVAPDTLRAQVHRGKLRANKLGRDWVVSSEEVNRYREASQRARVRRGTKSTRQSMRAGDG